MTKTIKKIAERLSKTRFHFLSIYVYKFLSFFKVDYDTLNILGNYYLSSGKFDLAAKCYFNIIKLQPTLSTVYDLGFHISKNSDLNIVFKNELIKLIKNKELREMIQFINKAENIFQPSNLWQYFMVYNGIQIDVLGLDNFKRTVNNNYFNWTGDKDVDTQFKAVIDKLNFNGKDLEKVYQQIDYKLENKPTEFTEVKWNQYCKYLVLLFEHTKKIDTLKLLDTYSEPMYGNPIHCIYKKKIITQDLLNTIIELNTIVLNTNLDLETTCKIILELGAGHGRIPNMLFSKVQNIKYIVVDIPAALYVSQSYISKLNPNLNIFKFRDFSKYEDVEAEFLNSNVIFLSPPQVRYLKDKSIDLFINICSLQEMRLDQIDYWFKEIDRVCNGYFYTKQYYQSNNPFDNICIMKEDYPIRNTWRTILAKQNETFPELFEEIYKIN